MSKTDIDNILELPELFKELKESKRQGNEIKTEILKNIYLKFPFLFGCLKTVLADQELLTIE